MNLLLLFSNMFYLLWSFTYWSYMYFDVVLLYLFVSHSFFSQLLPSDVVVLVHDEELVGDADGFHSAPSLLINDDFGIVIFGKVTGHFFLAKGVTVEDELQ